MRTRLPFFTVVCVSGEDRAVFMHGQFSNDISHLAEDSTCYAAYNTSKGHVLANILVLNRGSDLLLIMATDLTEAIVKHPHIFVLRVRIIFKPLPGYTVAAMLDEDTEAHATAEPSPSFPATEENGAQTVSLPYTGRLKIGEAERLPEHDAATENAWNLYEIRNGYTWTSTATKGTTAAQMLNQHIVDDVRFKKDYYPGQGIIARAQYRGQVKRGLTVLPGGSLEAVGIAMLENGAETDQIVSTALIDTGSLSLAVIKHVAIQVVLIDADGSNLKQEKLFFNIEPRE